MQLDGRVALITGGARGLGRASAAALLAEGAAVYVADVLVEEGARTAAELGEGCEFLRLDVTSESEWAAAVARIDESHGRLDILVNNAGILRRGSLRTFTREDFDEVMAVNVTGQFLGIKAVAPLMQAQGAGSIVNVSSNYGLRGTHALHGYTASKFAVRGLTKSAAAELARYGIRVNSLHPAAMRTSMIGDVDDSAAANRFGRIPGPEEIAQTVLFLASDASSFSTGAEFLVDGGETQVDP